MFVVDTNVLASLLIDGPFSPAARSLLTADPDWHSEPFVLVELSNVLATQVRAGRLTLEAAQIALSHGAATMEGRLHPIEHAAALTFAQRYVSSAYDARYLAVAHGLGQRLVTEDAALRRKAPDLTCSLAEALEAAQ
ncbi:MAG: type II toxin-antitoxin system VapC family toxin [Proteobacteria bacterium]|nr:type II toxin-antitoxin system VapC family toxin [Pseudomonadota bacterium]